MKTAADRLILTGMMGSGKTTIGRWLARTLGWVFIDIDREIERQTGKSISQLFAEKGEAFFRELEKEVVRRLEGKTGCVIATGGGTVADPYNRRLLARNGRLVYLKASAESLAKRLKDTSDRPLLQAGDVLETIRRLLDEREAAYSAAHWTVTVDGKPPAGTVQEILWRFVENGVQVLDSSLGVFAGPGSLRNLPQLLRERRVTAPVLFLVDERVWKFSQAWLSEWLEKEFSGCSPEIVVWRPSERKKTLATAHWLWGKLHELRLERSGAVVAVGGGVVTDVAGFTASTYKRGVRLFLVPTTLLAQVDAAVGGKTGVNFGGAKNMIGTFYPADAVLLDPLFLLTLPGREFRAGMAEVIKAAVLDSSAAVAFLQRESRAIRQRRLTELTRAIQQAVTFKLQVVKEDLQERSGKRMLLNFGHTLGHAIEAHFGYRIKHGEAVSIGMVAAANLAVQKGLCSPALAASLEALLRRFRLPVQWPDLPFTAVVERLQHDKKRRQGKIRFVLPEDFGAARIAEVDLEVDLRPFLEQKKTPESTGLSSQRSSLTSR
jgi:3-dehydroquinate synthase